ncbi:MAG TPA: hypothetical protein DEQ23_03655 [Chlorobium sp.]|nr:hypothetical protein [Chlorobium sp.]
MLFTSFNCIVDSRIFFTFFQEHHRLDYPPEAVCTRQRAEDSDVSRRGSGATANGKKKPEGNGDE